MVSQSYYKNNAYILILNAAYLPQLQKLFILIINIWNLFFNI